MRYYITLRRIFQIKVPSRQKICVSDQGCIFHLSHTIFVYPIANNVRYFRLDIIKINFQYVTNNSVSRV